MNENALNTTITVTALSKLGKVSRPTVYKYMNNPETKEEYLKIEKKFEEELCFLFSNHKKNVSKINKELRCGVES